MTHPRIKGSINSHNSSGTNRSTTTQDHASKVKYRLDLDLVPLIRTRDERVYRLRAAAPVSAIAIAGAMCP